jgi:hypothetical protein
VLSDWYCCSETIESPRKLIVVMESDASEACGRKKQWCNCRYLRPKNSVRIDHLRADVSTPDFRSTEHSVGSFLSLMEVLVGAV